MADVATIEMENAAVKPPVKYGFLRSSALIEIALFFVGALLIDTFFFKGDRFWTINPHPFWIIVLLTSVQYGVKEGFFTALVATAVLLVGNLPPHDQAEYLFSYLYEVSFNPIFWLVAALILGELRQRQVRRYNKVAQERYESRVREENIAEKYNEMRKIKENLEFRVAGQLRTAFSAYEAARSVESVEPDDVLEGIENLIGVLLGAEQFSIYLFKNDRLVLHSAHGWANDAPYVREFDSSNPLYQEVLIKGRVLNLVNEADEQKLQGQGMLAGSFYDAVSGRVFGVIKVESLGFSVLNFSTIESFKVLCEWVGSAYARSLEHQQARRDSLVNPGSQVLSGGFLRHTARYLPELAKRIGFDASLITIRMVGAAKLDSEMRRVAAKALGRVIAQYTRKIDQLFEESLNADNALPHSEFTLILPNTPLSNASLVVQKIQRQLSVNTDAELAGIELQFNIQSLFQRQAA